MSYRNGDGGIFRSSPFLFNSNFLRDMNKGARLVADAVLGEDFKVVVLGGKAYKVSPPTIATICKGIQYLSLIDKTTSGKEDLEKVRNDLENILKGLSVFVFGSADIYKEIDGATLHELREALETVVKFISAEDFFVCAALAESVARMAATPR